VEGSKKKWRKTKKRRTGSPLQQHSSGAHNFNKFNILEAGQKAAQF
jgi:hypothetical protein